VLTFSETKKYGALLVDTTGGGGSWGGQECLYACGEECLVSFELVSVCDNECVS